MIDWNRIQNALRPFAPAAAGALTMTGPIGAAAAVMLGKALGVPPTPAAIQKAIETDPKAAEKIAAAEAKIASVMMGDYTDARKTMAGHWMTWLVSIVIVVMWAGWRVMLFFFEVPPDNIALIAPAETQATLNFAFAAVIGFWIGSSRGSVEKQETIDRSMAADAGK